MMKLPELDMVEWVVLVALVIGIWLVVWAIMTGRVI